MENSQIKRPSPIPQKLFKTCFWKSPDGNVVEVLVPVPLPSCKKEEPLDLIKEKIQNLMPVTPAPFPRAIATVSAIASAPIIVPPSVSKTTNSSRMEPTVINSKFIPSNQIMAIQKTNEIYDSKPVYKTVPISAPSITPVSSSNVVKSSQTLYNNSLTANQLPSIASIKGQIQGRLKGPIFQKNLNFTNQISNGTVKSNSINVLPLQYTELPSQSVLKINNPNSVITVPQASPVKVLNTSAVKLLNTSPMKLLNTSGKFQILQPQGKIPVIKQTPLKNTTANMPVKLIPIITKNNVSQLKSTKPNVQFSVLESIKPNILKHSKTENIKADPTPLKTATKPATAPKIAFMSNPITTANSSVIINDKATKLIPLPKLPPGFVYAFQNNPVTVLNMPIIVSPNLGNVSSKVNDEKNKIKNISADVKIKTEPSECNSSDDNVNLSTDQSFKNIDRKDKNIITEVKKESLTTLKNISNLVQNVNSMQLQNKNKDSSLQNKIIKLETEINQVKEDKQMLCLDKAETKCLAPHEKISGIPMGLIKPDLPKYDTEKSNNLSQPSENKRKPQMIPIILRNNQKTAHMFSHANPNNGVAKNTNKPNILQRTLPRSFSESSRKPLNISVEKPNNTFSTNAYNQQFIKFILHSPSQNKESFKNFSNIIKKNNLRTVKNKLTYEGERNLQISKVIPFTEGNAVSSLNEMNDPLDMFIPEIEIIEEEKSITIPNWSPVKITHKNKKRRSNIQTEYNRINKMKSLSPEYITPRKRLRPKCKLQMCKSKTSNLLGDCYVVLRPLKMKRIADDSVNLKDISETELFSDDDECDLFSKNFGSGNSANKRLRISISPNDSSNNLTEEDLFNNSKLHSSDRTMSVSLPQNSSMLKMKIQTVGKDFYPILKQNGEAKKPTSQISLQCSIFKNEISGKEMHFPPQEYNQNIKQNILTDKHNNNSETSKELFPSKRNFQYQMQTPNGNARIHLLKQRLLDALKETEKLSQKKEK